MTDSAAMRGPAHRIAVLDVARTAALCGMVLFHFVFDLEAFGYLAPGTALTGGWAVFARVVAGSFLALAGISLYLAHRHAIRWAQVWPRLARIGGAAALISAGTWVALGDRMIFFGILHQIAFASVAGLLFLRLPWVVVAAAAVCVAALPQVWRSDLFAGPWLIWTGLGTRATPAADFVPVFPWFGAVLAGIALAKGLSHFGVWARLAALPASPALLRLGWPGRHSLVIYLIHQPVLIGLLWLYAKAVG